MSFSVPPLPYAYDALEPHIDAKTMEIHHDKHHQAYVDKLNAAVEGTELADKPLEELLADIDALPADKQGPIRNNGGGHYNHSLFWPSLSPDGGGEPTGEVAAKIDEAFGSFDAFKTQFQDAGVARFGSGWVWLVTSDAGFEIVTTPNQDTPLPDGKRPLLGNDVWEHAYYLQYQNRRPAYLEAFWNVVDWDVVGRRLGA
jgi:Fe-Mn family superoxide dismutase